MRLSRALLLALVAMACLNVDVRADWWKPGASVKKLWGSSSSSTSPTPPSQSASQPAARTASSTNSRVPTAPQQSNMTFAPAPGAPQPSVTMPAATSPAGRVATSAPKRTWKSRFSGAAAATRDALTFKPREVPAEDPVRLSNNPVAAQPGIFVSAARVYESQGRMKEARLQYDKALKVDPQHADALVGLARLHHREGELEAATELYQRALRAHPANAVVLNDLGLCYARRGMLDQARSSMEKAIAQDQRSKLYRNNLAVVLVEMNDPNAALGHLQVVHGEAVAHYNLGYMLSEKGQTEAAAHHLQTALAIEPRMEPARQMLARLEPRPAPNAAPHLGAPQVNPAEMPQYRQPEVQPRRDVPVNYRQSAPQESYTPPQPTAPAQGGYAPTSGNYYPPSEQYSPINQNQAPPRESQQLPPDQGWVPNAQSAAPVEGGRAHASLRDETPAAETAHPTANENYRPTVNYVQPPMNPAEPPQNYVFPPAQPSVPAAQSQPQEAPLPGELPAYLRGQSTQPQVAPAQGSRWSN